MKTEIKENERSARKPSLTSQELAMLAKCDAMCPFGRNTEVGGIRCENCIFHRLSDDACYGSKEKVMEHRRRLRLEY